ncbi:cyclic peptide export ABC transporter [Burkholderia sp. Bp9017]|uniref:cyclic peptide export ABC transporter n=1 Tax=Burkholderia TaxID=32008 RepID=UPI000F5EFFAE|nr:MULTISPECIES: cyclic peptide export ABC transporter [Burkholderia]MBY4865171.1 cyclic peptide export ABC transporter [Burkholderia anthina]RQZ23572.1 cyclic peptide export ABC transporter [Burkholderia sp. Bp9017]RQZ36166.1 cyclic peptide export ABC transporter [Burkholderia sp. Bp9016]
MSLFRFLTGSFRWTLPLALLTSLASGIGNAVLIALINQALGASAERLVALGWRFAAVVVAVLAARAVSQMLFMSLGQRAKAMLRMRTIRRIGDAAYPDLERLGSAKSLSVLTQDLDTIVVFFVNLPTIAMQGAVIAGCLAYLGYLSWQILLFAAVTIGVAMLGFRVVQGRALTDLRDSRRREDDLVRHFRALFDGAKELKLHRARRAAFVDEMLAPGVEAVRVQRTRGYMLYAAAASWGNLVLFAFIGLTLFVLARWFEIDARVASGYAMVFLYMIMPIEGLLAAIPSVSIARVAFERIEQLDAELPREPVGGARPVHAFGRIALDGVTHRYVRDGEAFTLGPIDLSFAPGETVFLIGGNGSGKTTLAKLITGLYAPEGGRILLDGEPVDAASRERYRHLFSAVFSDFFLFERLFGIDMASRQRARALLDALQLSHKVAVDGGAFSTLELSQGQRKRLALLVAYLEDRPFYVFDEWAADQDPLFKDVFYRQLLPELKARGKTVLVISHDDRYFALADRSVKLDYGQIVAQSATVAPHSTVSPT